MEILSSIFLGLIFLFSVVIHEVSHGFMADSLGDPTARLAGRLTLNPLKHLDPIGSILLPGILFLTSLISGGRGIIFGWTKPVPINPYHFKNQKYGTLKVALAGPLSNFLLAFLFGILIRFLPRFLTIPTLENINIFFSYIVWINLILFIFNLWPAPPFDGFHIISKILPSFAERLRMMLYKSFLFSSLGAVLFMMFIGVPYICFPLFNLLTGL
jgi:Zn-dependent protease